jgi:hypothetical protein
MDPAGPLFSMVATKRGGLWGHRLQQRCHTIMGDVGEDELYALYHGAGAEEGLVAGVCGKACRGNAVLLGAALAPVPLSTPTPQPATPSKNSKKSKKSKKTRVASSEEL